MEWKTCACPICGAKGTKSKELDLPSQVIYNCPECSEFAIMGFKLGDYPILLKQISENDSLISRYLRNFNKKNDAPTSNHS